MTNGINSFDNNDANIKRLGNTNAGKSEGTPRYVYHNNDKGDSLELSTKNKTKRDNPIVKWFKTIALATAVAASSMGVSSCTQEENFEGRDVVITNDVTIDMSVMNDLLQKILNKLDEMNQNIVVGNETISSQITDLYEELQNGQIDDQLFFQKIIDLLGNINENVVVGDTTTQELLKQLLEQYQAGQIDYKEMLNKILDVLGSIDSSLDDLLSQFGDFVNNYNKNNEQYQQNFDQMLDWMSTIDSSIKDNHIDMSKLEEIVSNITVSGGATQESLDKILQAIIDVKNSTEANKPITVEDLENVLKQYVNDDKDYTEILNTIKELLEQGGVGGGSGSNITIDQLEQIIKDNKTDLTKVTQLMTSILNALNNLNLGGSIGGGDGDVTVNVDLSTIEGLLNDLINKFDQGRIDETELLEEISGKLDNMVTVEDLDGLLNKYYSQLKADSDEHTANILDAIKDITITGGTGVDMDALEELIAKYANNNDDVIAALDKIYDKMDELAQNSGGGSGSGITIREIENLIQQYYKDPTPILSEIKGLLEDLGTGDRITMDQLEQLLEANKTDLTKVTQLMTSILNALQNNSGNGVDMSSLESKINSLINTYNNGNADLSATLEKILDAIRSL